VKVRNDELEDEADKEDGAEIREKERM